MSTHETTPSPCIASPPQPGCFRRFVRLCASAIVLIVLSIALFQATSSAIAKIATPVGLGVSFAIWQAALVFLCSSGREVVAQNIKKTAALNTLYVAGLTAAVSLFFL